jgi:hypothetical protein
MWLWRKLCSLIKNYFLIAQMVEQLTVNQRVRGSSPRQGAKYTERWPRGLRQRFAKPSYPKRYQWFESTTLRHNILGI